MLLLMQSCVRPFSAVLQPVKTNRPWSLADSSLQIVAIFEHGVGIPDRISTPPSNPCFIRQYGALKIIEETALISQRNA